MCSWDLSLQGDLCGGQRLRPPVSAAVVVWWGIGTARTQKHPPPPQSQGGGGARVFPSPSSQDRLSTAAGSELPSERVKGTKWIFLGSLRLPTCYGLSCVPQNSYVEALAPSMTAFGDGA